MKRSHSEVAATDTSRMAERRLEILSRLEEINGPSVPLGYSSSIEKTTLHWDHVMQEMVSKDYYLLPL